MYNQLEADLRNGVHRKVETDLVALLTAHQTIAAGADIPLVQVTEADSKALYDHWTGKGTNNRQKELEELKAKCLRLKTPQKSNNNNKRSDTENYPPLPDETENFIRPKETSKPVARLLQERATKTDNMFQKLSEDETETENDIENNPQEAPLKKASQTNLGQHNNPTIPPGRCQQFL
ncbi:hypothetical protein JTB14_004291 [Gonioctena quinquepunctata]|nr:hypothetical protein JTB14_004291 [Gonioctena quinquepunctata]